MVASKIGCAFFLFQNLPADIKESITDIIKFMLQREYVKVHFYHTVHWIYGYRPMYIVCIIRLFSVGVFYIGAVRINMRQISSKNFLFSNVLSALLLNTAY